MVNRPLNIFVVEDSPADVRLLREALRHSEIPWDLQVAVDGEEAVKVLQKRAADGNCPDLILLDLNLPRKSGHEVLRDLKSGSTLRHIPVVVLSSSRADRDITTAYDLHANCFISKPADLDQFYELVRVLEDFWHKRVQLVTR